METDVRGHGPAPNLASVGPTKAGSFRRGCRQHGGRATAHEPGVLGGVLFGREHDLGYGQRVLSISVVVNRLLHGEPGRH